jgi:hypothetical protein
LIIWLLVYSPTVMLQQNPQLKLEIFAPFFAALEGAGTVTTGRTSSANLLCLSQPVGLAGPDCLVPVKMPEL